MIDVTKIDFIDNKPNILAVENTNKSCSLPLFSNFGIDTLQTAILHGVYYLIITHACQSMYLYLRFYAFYLF